MTCRPGVIDTAHEGQVDSLHTLLLGLRPMALSPKASPRKPRKARPRATTRPTAPVVTPEPEKTPDLIGVVDVGSRALRMAVAEIAPGRLRRLETLLAPVAIGLDTFSHGRIRAVTSEVVIRTLRDFALALETYQLKPADCLAVATTAVRDATNREVFLDFVQQRTGFRVQVLEAIEETRLAHQLTWRLMGERLATGRSLVLALGAGGTQIILQNGEDLELAESRSFGTLKLLELRPSARTVGSARRFLQKVVASIARVHELATVESVVAISGELHRLLVGLGHPSQPNRGICLDRAGFQKLANHLDTSTLKEVAEDSGVDISMAELARMAFEELRAFTTPCSPERVFIPESSMLDSLLLDATLKSQMPEQVDNDTPVESAAWAVARRYHISITHARQVRLLALQLFDGTRDMSGLGERARTLLAVAAILHDIGIFVSTHRHERHSAYLIEASEVMGLNPSELARVAAIVRHHRHPFRDIDTRDLGPLRSRERVEVLKLTALLRIADALDTTHHHRVVRLRVATTHEELQVIIETQAGEREGFADLQRAFCGKADLLEEVFGMKPRLIEVLAE
ncbi:MAG: HD domain-containing protein [Deltaproteobacteria bacterium]|nr:HD domain-containing protein [Deltaproteobacteria bacterium]